LRAPSRRRSGRPLPETEATRLAWTAPAPDDPGATRPDEAKSAQMDSPESRNTCPLKIPAPGAPYARMITCPSSLEVRRLDRRADSTMAPRHLPSQKSGPELVVKDRRVRTPQGAHQRPLHRKDCRGRLPPTDHPRHLVSIDSLRRALGVPKLPATHGQSRAHAGGRSPLNQAARHGGLPVSSWFPS